MFEDKSSKEGNARRVPMQLWVVFGVVVLLIQLGVIGGLLQLWRNIRTKTVLVNPGEMCVTAENFVKKPGRIPVGVNATTMNNETAYCGSTGNVLKWQAEMILDDMYSDDSHPEKVFKEETVPSSCHRVSYTENVTKIVDIDNRTHADIDPRHNFPRTVFWKNASGSFLTGDMVYQAHNGSVRIARQSLYFVSTQISLKMDDKPETLLTHYVYKRDSNGKTVLLMENKKTPCRRVTADQATTTSFTGAEFALNESDHVFVATDTPEDLVPGASMNFFIIYELD